jgi:hypothetical protein
MRAMSKAWTSLQTWLSKHSISSKTIASVWLFIVAMFYAEPSFREYVKQAYTHLPLWLHGFIAGVVLPACLFWKTWKTVRETPTASVARTASATSSANSSAANSFGSSGPLNLNQ